MQTFVPVTSSYADIAKVLDNKRLNKQALEAWQILMTNLQLDPAGNHRSPKGWANHPAVRMWRDHDLSLYDYIVAMTTEWKRRGFKTTIADKAAMTLSYAKDKHRLFLDITEPPAWFGDEAIASTHRQALLVKDYGWYSRFPWPENTGVKPLEYEYIWPV